MQDVQGKIRESLYEDGWSNGTEKNVIASARFGSPIAVTSKELDNVSMSTYKVDYSLTVFRSGYITSPVKACSRKLPMIIPRAGTRVALSHHGRSLL